MLQTVKVPTFRRQEWIDHDFLTSYIALHFFTEEAEASPELNANAECSEG